MTSSPDLNCWRDEGDFAVESRINFRRRAIVDEQLHETDDSVDEDPEIRKDDAGELDRVLAKDGVDGNAENKGAVSKSARVASGRVLD